MNTQKYNITTDGELIVKNDTINETPRFRGNKDDLIDYLNYRVKAMEEHIKFLESECNALYSQLPIT